jgi:gliding motility-associated-like protein
LLGASVTVTPNSNTTYTVNGTNGAGCIGTQTISINVNSLPVVNAGASQTICTGQSVTLTGTGSATSYTWNNGVINNIAFTATISNSYIVMGTDVNSCSNTDTVEVIINPILSLSLSASTNSICIGNSVILSANGATTYTWNPGLLSGASVTVNPTSNITYSVNGDNGTGCVGSETISLLVQQLPNVVATASSTNICVGQTVSLAGSGATNYNWNNGVIDGIAFSPTTTNSYIVSGTDIFGCTSTTTILVNVYSGTAAIPSVNPGVICIGDTSYLSVIGGSIPTWSLNTYPNLLYVAPITDVSYTYSAVDNNGCIGDIIFNISIDEACAIKVYNGFTPNGDGINDFWIIDNIENYSTNKVYIYNRWGTLMYSTSNYNNFDNVWDGKFNGQAVTSGTYFYVIESNQLIKKGWIEITN